jgi:hypothetical protein
MRKKSNNYIDFFIMYRYNLYRNEVFLKKNQIFTLGGINEKN